MKTAMQELIEKLSMKSGDSFYALAFYHDNDKIIKEALEKEKEQIVDAYEAAMERPIDNYAEAYYNMNYNQTYNNEKD